MVENQCAYSINVDVMKLLEVCVCVCSLFVVALLVGRRLS